MPLDSLGRMVLVMGLVIALVGLGMILFGRVPFLGSLPGDLSFQLGNVRVYIPIVTSIVLSIILTIVLNVMFGRR